MCKILNYDETLEYYRNKFTEGNEEVKSFSNIPKYAGKGKGYTWNESRAKTTILIQLDNGNIAYVTDKVKPVIHSTMWYNDETEGPEENLNNFIKYNMSNTIDDDFINNIECINEYNHIDKLRYDNINNCYILNDKEKEIIKNKLKELQLNYIERLKRYYKRYNKYICACGYWVNR